MTHTHCGGPLADWSVEAVPRGTKANVRLTVPVGLTGPVSVSVLVARGGPGPTFVAMAGVHGDEFEGVLAVGRLWARLDPGAVRGTFIGVPVANPLAFEAQTRESPPFVDGLNLARIFPGRAAGTPTEMLAHALDAWLTRHLAPGTDLFMDLHSAGTRYDYLPMACYRLAGPPDARQRSRAAAHVLGLPRVWAIEAQPGRLNSVVAERGVTTVATETHGGAGAAPEDVAAYERALRGAGAHLGLWDDALPSGAADERRCVTIAAPASGLFDADRRLGAEVRAGERIATIRGVGGDVLAEVASPAAGTLWALRRFASVRSGDIAALVALKASASGKEASA